MTKSLCLQELFVGVLLKGVLRYFPKFTEKEKNYAGVSILMKFPAFRNLLTMIWVGFLGACFVVGGEVPPI